MHSFVSYNNNNIIDSCNELLCGDNPHSHNNYVQRALINSSGRLVGKKKNTKAVKKPLAVKLENLNKNAAIFCDTFTRSVNAVRKVGN